MKTRRETRRCPFVLITGVPGSGKTTMSDALAERIGCERIDVGKLVEAEGFYGAYDEAYDTRELREDALLDRMEELLGDMHERGVGCVVDYHSCELFPERWFDVVVALTCVENTAELYERLSARGYGERKIRENVECDIFQVVVEEAKESYEEVWVRSNVTADQMEETVEEIAAWYEARCEAGA